jgi:hypothetical protein
VKTRWWIGFVLTGCLAVGDAINADAGPSPHLHWLADTRSARRRCSPWADGQLLSAGAGLKRWDVSARRLKRTLSTPRAGEDVIALGPGQIAFTARGPTGPLRWETHGDKGAWEPVPDQSGPEVILSATGPQRWVRAGLAVASR